MYNQIHYQRCHFTNKGKCRGDVHEGSSCLALSLSTVFQVASCQFWQGCVCCTAEAPAGLRPRTSSRLCRSPTFQQVQTPNKLSTASRRALAWVGEQIGRGCGMDNLAKGSGRRSAAVGKGRQGEARGKLLRSFRQGSWWFLYSKGGGSTMGPISNNGLFRLSMGVMVASSCSAAADCRQHREDARCGRSSNSCEW